MKESVMFANNQISRSAQRVVCIARAAIIVAASLSIGAFGAQSALHDSYSVTITQLQ
jgi:hypothetical protein